MVIYTHRGDNQINCLEETEVIEKVHVLAEMKLAGMNVDKCIEKMYAKFGKSEFQMAIKVSGYANLFGI